MNPRPDPGRREHEEFRLLAAAAVDGRLDADSAMALEEHLRDCAECRADQQAMLEDHVWLATPRRLDPPSPQVREFVLEAARSHRIPRTSSADRPWAAFAAAALVVAVIGGGIVLALRPTSNGSGAATSTPNPTTGQSPSAGETCVPIPTGLTARWAFDGNPAERLAGIETTLLGDAKLVVGLTGFALHLSGPASEATVADTRAPDFGTGDFTLGTWVRFSTSTDNQVLLERWSQDPVDGWTLTTTENGELRLAVATDSTVANGEFDIDTSGAALTVGRWHHVGIRREGRTFVIFVDGWRRGSSTLLSSTQADLSIALPLLFGRRGDGAYHLDGALDDVLVWNGRALPDREVSDVYRAGTAKFCEAAAAGFVGTWQSVDCAATGATTHCEVWGDESELSLVIGDGENPDVRYEDVSQADCGPGGTAGARVATGHGTYVGTNLEIDFTDVNCDMRSDSWSNPLGLYRTAGRQELWDDPDGDEWGLIWRPG